MTAADVVYAELSADGKRIEVRFPYSQIRVAAIKRVKCGARFNRGESIDADGATVSDPHWRVPLELTSARLLREAFGEELELGPKLMKWGREQVAHEQEMQSLADADDAELVNLPRTNPKLAEFLRPYQRADAAMMARANVINANQPGLGKTVASIASVFERGNHNGCHLIIAPKTSLETVWQYELERFTDDPVLVLSGDDDKQTRIELMELALEWAEDGTPFWFVMNPAFLALDKDRDEKGRVIMISKNGKLVPQRSPRYRVFFDIKWNTIMFDEYHKMGLSNNSTQMFEAANSLQIKPDGQKVLISGTPMGGKPIKLWGGLHFLHPEKFASKWRFADNWLTVEDGYGGHKKIEGIRDERRDEFWRMLQPYMVRRTKAEVLKELPPKQYVDVWCDMTPKQKSQYDAMAADAEVRIDEEHLSATGVLAEYTRLKQFADAHCRATKFADGSIMVVPTANSGKLPHVMEILSDRGITPHGEDDEGDEQVVIGSQFSAVIEMLAEYFDSKGIAYGKISGKVSGPRRKQMVDDFQAGRTRVMLIVTTAGGVSITLDRASTMIIMDETWVPDDQEQLEDRIHRGSRIHQVTIYYLRSKNTIEEHIQKVVMDKQNVNRDILDLRRQGLHA